MPTASQITHVELDAARTISAETIRVDGIIVANTTGSVDTVTFRNAAAVVILTIEVPANDSEQFTGSFIAEGLNIDLAASGVFVTVIHSFGA